MLSKLKKMFKSRFVKNIILVASGTAFAQLLTIMLSPIITRIYSPEEYGVLTVYASLLSLLSVGATLNYHRAIPLSKSNKKSINVIALSFIILILFSCFILVILQLKGEALMTLLNSNTLMKYMYFIPFGAFFLGIYTILLQWALRIKDFKSITKTTVTQSIISNISKIIFGVLGFGSPGLLIAHVIGQSGGISRLLKPLLAHKHEFKKSITIKEVRKVARKYSQFPFYTTPNGYVYTAGNQAPVIILSSIFGTSVVGFYGLANSIVNLPIGLIATSVSQVFYSEVAGMGKKRSNEIKALSLKLTKKLALIGLLPLTIFILFGPWLFTFVFGSNWGEAGIYAQVLSVVAYSHFVILPIGRVLELLNKEIIGLIINVVRLIAIFSVFIIAFLLDLNPLTTVTMYTAVSSLSYVALFVAVQTILSKEQRNV